jgi:hypothetical protein
MNKLEHERQKNAIALRLVIISYGLSHSYRECSGALPPSGLDPCRPSKAIFWVNTRGCIRDSTVSAPFNFHSYCPRELEYVKCMITILSNYLQAPLLQFSTSPQSPFAVDSIRLFLAAARLLNLASALLALQRRNHNARGFNF